MRWCTVVLPTTWLVVVSATSVVGAAAPSSSLLGPSSLASFTTTTRHHHRSWPDAGHSHPLHTRRTHDLYNSTRENSRERGLESLSRPSEEHPWRKSVNEEGDDLHPLLLLLRSAGGNSVLSPPPATHTQSSNTQENLTDSSDSFKWRCLVEWLKIHSADKKSEKRTCDKKEIVKNNKTQEKLLEDCVPLLFLVMPSLCNGTQSCVNVTEGSLESLLHQYLIWDRKKKRHDQADDAVIYIVVVLAFYSFGIVFMMANFVRQEQRELEETKMYKQYVKVARDRWLTTRGNLTNKLALQALNTFNAVPQTTDANKVTFV